MQDRAPSENRPDPIEDALFVTASALTDPLSREAFLKRTCGQNRQLRLRLDLLLEAEVLASLDAHTGGVQMVRFLAGGQTVASAGALRVVAALQLKNAR